MELDGLILLVIGFIAAVLGVSLPGLLNMTAVKINKEKGQKSAFEYVLGALLVIFFQTFVAIFFARLIESSPLITEILHEIGLVVFGGLTIYFIGFAKNNPNREKPQVKWRSNSFVMGILLALVNVFSIPYYVFLSVTLASYSFDIFSLLSMSLFSIGVVGGSALMFYIYMLCFRKLISEDAFVFRNINTIIGSITGLICLITIFKLIG